MFGRLFKITLINTNTGDARVIVDTKERRYNDYICEGTISRFPGSEKDSLELSVYNLDSITRGEIAVGFFDTITVDFGYKDEDDGALSNLFTGTIFRPQHTRDDAVTDKTIIYAYDSGNFKFYGFFSKTYLDGANFYDIAKDVAEQGTVTISTDLATTLKNYIVKGSLTLHDSQDTILENIADTCGCTYKVENGVAKIFSPTSDEEEAVLFSKTQENGKIVSTSGMIGIPSLESDGVQIKCLINPKLSIYKKIKIDNSIISSNQNGSQPTVSAGGQLNSDGVYKIIKMVTTFGNADSQSYTTLKAISVNVFEEVT